MHNKKMKMKNFINRESNYKKKQENQKKQPILD